ncbi:MAG: RNA polymerase sigma factor [Puniceicoccaceae bacterium]
MSVSMVQVFPNEIERGEEWHRFQALAKEYYEPVYAFLARQTPNQADAADVTQHAFIRAYKSFGRFDSQRDFAPWIYSIARRSLVDFYRKRRHTVEALEETIEDPSLNPGESVEQQEGQDNLWLLAKELKPKFNQVLLLHYKENFSLKETAEIMGVTLTHAKVLLFRARNALKKKIEATQLVGGNER